MVKTDESTDITPFCHTMSDCEGETTPTPSRWHRVFSLSVSLPEDPGGGVKTTKASLSVLRDPLSGSGVRQYPKVLAKS